MGKLENISKKKRLKENIQKGILISVGLAGFLAIATVTPNVVKLLNIKKIRKNFGSNTNRSRDRLIEKGLLVFVDYKGKRYLKMTDKGKRQLRDWGIKDFSVDKPKKWDKKWRMLSFDIFEKRRHVRDKLRIILKKIGFYQIQRSVWAYPYDCEDFIQLLKADFKVGWGILYIIADQIENEKVLKKHFELE